MIARRGFIVGGLASLSCSSAALSAIKFPQASLSARIAAIARAAKAQGLELPQNRTSNLDPTDLASIVEQSILEGAQQSRSFALARQAGALLSEINAATREPKARGLRAPPSIWLKRNV